MASVLEKLRLIGLSNLHSVLDKVIDLNSVAAVEQHVRDLKSSRETVDDGVAQSIARLRLLTKEQQQKTARVAQLTAVITQILTDDDPTNDSAAEPKMAEKMKLDVALLKLASDREMEAQTQGTLTEALVLINGRISELEERLVTLRSTETQAHAKEEASRALKAARQILDSGPGSSVDNALQRAERRESAAGAQLEREVAGLRNATAVGQGDNTEVKAALAAFKAGLKPKQSPASPSVS